MKVVIQINGEKSILATLENNSAAKDFASLLPLSLDLRDFAGTEKASNALPEKLDIKGSPEGHKPSAGELTLYAPWNNLAIFYKDDKYAEGLVYLGRIDDNPDVLNIPGSIRVEIELAANPK